MSEEQKQEVVQTAAAESATAGAGSLLDQLVETARIRPDDEAYSITKQGLQAFISQLLEPQRGVERVTQATVDDMIAELDKKLCAQVDTILHNEQFQKLESAWRSLKFLVDQTNFRENVCIDVVNARKEDLLQDFEDAPEIVKAGLYKTVYTAEYGQFGGQPYGAMIANYEFGPGPQDIKLLQHVASVAAMSHARLLLLRVPNSLVLIALMTSRT